MKQAADVFTQELPDMDTEQTTTSKFRFSFHIRTLDGATTEWTGLTAKRAKDMYAYTQQSQPSNVASFGWEEMK